MGGVRQIGESPSARPVRLAFPDQFNPAVEARDQPGLPESGQCIAGVPVTAEDAEAFVNRPALASRYTYRARLSTLFRFAVRPGWMRSNPCERLEQVPLVAHPPTVFTRNRPASRSDGSRATPGPWGAFSCPRSAHCARRRLSAQTGRLWTWPDRYIAGILNRIGSQTGPGNSWSENRVKSFRGQHQIPVFTAGSQRPWLTMQDAAQELNVSVAVVRTMVKRGELPARQIAKGVPWMIQREDLRRPNVLSYAKQPRSRCESPREYERQIVIPCI